MDKLRLMRELFQKWASSATYFKKKRTMHRPMDTQAITDRYEINYKQKWSQ
jgi:hypothetical protein